LPTNYESLRMPAETRLYLPKLQAVKNIVARPADFNLRLPELLNHPYFLSVPIERDMDVAIAIKLAGMPLDEFQFLNPQMNRPVILAAGTPQVLLPYDNANRFVRELPKHHGPLASWTAWTAPRTMKTAEAARMVGMSEEGLREVNHIPARMLIKAGSTLVVPRGNALLADVSSEVADTAMLALSPEAPALRKTSLKAGHKDSVASVAKRYHVSAAQVAEWNQVAPGASFTPGQTIIVYSAATTRKTAGSQTVPGGPRASGATRTASGAKSTSNSQTARAGKATGVRQTPVARR
jgi:membrane-bound lytic murein transglycosylase D